MTIWWLFEQDAPLIYHLFENGHPDSAKSIHFHLHDADFLFYLGRS